MTKNGLIIKLITLIVAFLIIVALSTTYITGYYSLHNYGFNFPSFSFGFGTGEAELISSETFDGDSIDNINFDSSSQSIIVTSGSDNITVKYYSSSTDKNDFKPIINEDDGSLNISIKKRSIFSFVTSRSYVEVSVPEDKAYNYTLSTASGDITMEASTDYCKLSTVSGDIQLSSEYADDVTLNTTSGDINCTATSSSLSFNTTSGDIKSTVPCETVCAESVSGDITVDADENSSYLKTNTVSGDSQIILNNCSDYSVSFSTVSGKINDMYNKNMTKRGADYTVGNGTLKIQSESVSGDIIISK